MEGKIKSTGREGSGELTESENQEEFGKRLGQESILILPHQLQEGSFATMMHILGQGQSA
jgi:hypothetical protein